MQSWVETDRMIAAVANLVLWLYVDRNPRGGLGPWALPSPGMSAITFAVLVSESDGRPMNPSKLSYFAGFPRPTLYRKLEALRQRGIIAPGDAAIRAEPAFLESDILVEGTGQCVGAVRRCIDGMGGWLPSGARAPVTAGSRAGVLAGLALDLARLSHLGRGPWFAAEARSWLVHWCLLRAKAQGQAITPGGISDQTGVSRTAVYRQLEKLGQGGHLRRMDDGRFIPVGMCDPNSQQSRALHRMANAVHRAFHALSDLDALGTRS